MEIVSTKNAPGAIGPYSQAIILNGVVYTSGQVPLSPETGEVVGTIIEEQAEWELFWKQQAAAMRKP